MDVQQFVTETLKQIVSGVHGAQEAAKTTGATINPTGVNWSEKNPAIGTIHTYDAFISVINVDFDVAIVVTEGIEGGAGARLSVVGISAQVGGKAGSKTEVTSPCAFHCSGDLADCREVTVTTIQPLRIR